MRTRSGAMIDLSEAKQKIYDEHWKAKESEKQLLEQYIQEKQFSIADLSEVDPFIRKTLLRWIDRAAHSRNWRGKTEDGREYQVSLSPKGEYVLLRCTDGDLNMPNYHFTFDEPKERG
jgi:hypothetical protein